MINLTKKNKEKIFRLQYLFCLHKAYLDKGWALTNYIKYIIVIVGVTTQDLKTTLAIGAVYAILCYIGGWLWFKSNMVRAESEVGNRFNYFVEEVRDKIGTPKHLNTSDA